jgi:hypothetical protein
MANYKTLLMVKRGPATSRSSIVDVDVNERRDFWSSTFTPSLGGIDEELGGRVELVEEGSSARLIKR